MNLIETPLSSETIYDGKIIRVRLDNARLPNGAEALREVVEHPGGVCVAALTDKEELLFVRQFRYPYQEVVWELPAGKRDRNEETPLDCGKRELREETGAVAERYRSLGTLYPTPGYCDEVIHLFLAQGLSFEDADPDEDEFVEVERVPLKEAVERVLRGEIPDAKTQVAVLKTYFLLHEIAFLA